MRFAPTEEQTEFAAATGALLADTCPPSAVAAAWGGEVGRHTGLGDGDGRIRAAWDALVEMGVNGILVPEQQGGLAMSLDHLVGVLEECGYSALPDPVADSAGVVAHSLGQCSDTAPDVGAVNDTLAAVAAGSTVVSGFGSSPLVASATTADTLLMFTRDPTRVDPDAPADPAADRVVLLDRSEVDLEPVESVDGSRALARVRWDAASGACVAEGSAAAALTDEAFLVAALADSALLVGLGRAMIDLTVGYVGERKQFGVPVGSFQAVKHHLADAALAVQFAEPLVRNAAHLMSGGVAVEAPGSIPTDSRSVAVSAAKARSSDAAKKVTETALQCHGAIGYTVEADLHLFMKRAWALARSHGDSAFHLKRVRRQLLAG